MGFAVQAEPDQEPSGPILPVYFTVVHLQFRKGQRAAGDGLDSPENIQIIRRNIPALKIKPVRLIGIAVDFPGIGIPFRRRRFPQ